MKQKRRLTTFENCQSCGMPLVRDEQGGGTKTDGSKSKVYWYIHVSTDDSPWKASTERQTCMTIS